MKEFDFVGGGMLRDWPALAAIRTPGEREAVRIAAAQDFHTNMCHPTHALVRSGEIVGCMSIGNVPLVHTWLDQKRLKPRDTLRVFYLMENYGRSCGLRWVVVPSSPGAPLHEHLERDLGYQKHGEHFLFSKQLLGAANEG